MTKRILLIAALAILLIKITQAQDFWEVFETPPGIGIHSVDINSNNDILMGVTFASGGGILRKLNDENGWDTSLYLSNDAIGTVYIDKSDNIYAADAKFYYSDNNGDSWNLIYTNQLFGIRCIIKNSDDYIFFGTWGGIYKTDSMGSDWVEVLPLENYEVVNAIVEDTTTGDLYAGTTNYIGGGGIYRSVDDGNNWVLFGLTGHFLTSLAYNSTGDLFAGTRSGGVFRLPHEQTEWINLNNEEMVTSLVINSEDDIYIGCSTLDYYWGGVRRSMDNGESWEDISLETMYDRDITAMVLGTQEHLFAVEYNSETPLYKSINPTITSIPETEMKREIDAVNVPNPFSNLTTIAFNLPVDCKTATLNIYNLQGTLIRQFDITGKNKQLWDGKDGDGCLVIDGVYLYNIGFNNTFSSFNKLLFIH